jgi:hypothetical protein
MVLLELSDLTLMVYLGVLLQAILMLRGKTVSNRFFMCLAVPLILVILSRTILPALLAIDKWFFVLFMICLLVRFKEDILPVVTREVLLSWTILFGFLLVDAPSFLGTDANETRAFTLVAFVIMLAVMVVSFVNVKLEKYSKLFFYIWAVLISFMLSFYTLTESGGFSLLDIQDVTVMDVLGLILAGMVFFYSMMMYSLLFFVVILRFPGYSEAYTLRFIDTKPNPPYSFILLVAQLGSLVGNHYLNMLPDMVLVSMWLVFIEHITRLRLDDKPPIVY